MNILIAGCGRIGAGLANVLYKEGHDISVVDPRPDSFSALEDGFNGFRVTGVTIDCAVLREAGIEDCDLVAAVTGDDNTNLMISQIAKEIFRVPKVLTRLYDPARQEVYDQDGLHTVSPTSLTVEVIRQIISEADQESARVCFGDATLSLSPVEVPLDYRGKTVSQILHGPEEAIVGVLRGDGGLLFRENAGSYRLKKGDRILCARLV